MIHYAFGRADANGCRRIRVDHCLQQCCRCGGGSLLEAGDRLRESGAPGITKGLLELEQLEPAQERSGSNAGSAGSFVNVALSQEGRNRVFHLPPEFCSRSCHYMPIDAITWTSSPSHRLSDYLQNHLACLRDRRWYEKAGL